MKPTAFDYHEPATLDEALALLAKYGTDAKALAGGQSLIPAMNFRLAAPAVLIDLNRIDALSYIQNDSGLLRIGGMTRHRTLERSEVVQGLAPLVTAAMPHVAHAAIRTRGTIGGSLAHADPAAELPAVMLALDATFVCRDVSTVRSVRASDFFTGLFSTTLQPGELLTEIDVPARSSRAAFAFDEIARRRGDFAMAGAAARVVTDASGVCTSARVALLGVGERPVLSQQVAKMLAGERPTEAAIGAAAEAASEEDIDPASDIHASSRYRRRLAAVLIRRVLARAFNSLETP